LSTKGGTKLSASRRTTDFQSRSVQLRSLGLDFFVAVKAGPGDFTRARRASGVSAAIVILYSDQRITVNIKNRSH